MAPNAAIQPNAAEGSSWQAEGAKKKKRLYTYMTLLSGGILGRLIALLRNH